VLVGQHVDGHDPFDEIAAAREVVGGAHRRGHPQALDVLDAWGSERRAALERLGVAEPVADAVEALFAPLPDPLALPGPLSHPAVLRDLGSREVFSANSLEGWVGCSYRWFVDHELSPQRLEPEADPLWIGGVVHEALEGLYRDPPGSDAVPRENDLGRWRSRFAELLDDAATSRTGVAPTPARRAALDRARVQVEAFLREEAECASEFRPRPELLEVSFGPFEGEDEDHEALRVGDVFLRGRIDRIDVARDGRSAIVRDYKTGKSVTPAGKFADEGTLQIQLYMRVARDQLGLDPVAGLYHPLGATRESDRRPRGLLDRDDERLAPLPAVRTDRVDRERFEEHLDDALERAAQAAREMRAGAIDRRPLNGECPKYCTFQTICRLERALGAVGKEGRGASSGADGDGG
jgi:ATP-dependent helicase/DNAse subunit B